MASQLSIRRALGRNKLAALDKYLDDPLYKNRNNVIVAIGSFLSNGTLSLSNDDDDEDKDAEHAAAVTSKASSGPARKGRKSRKQQVAADEQQQQQHEAEGEAHVAAEDDADDDEALPTSAAFLSEDEKAELLSLLTGRIHDCHAYTRSKTLQTLTSLVSSRSLPPKLFFSLPPLAIDRLRDTSSAVRKYAIQLLTAACQYNPLGPDLGGDREREEIQRLGHDVQRLMEEDRRRREQRAAREASKRKQTDTARLASRAVEGEQRELDEELEELQLSDGEEQQGEQDTDEQQDEMEVSTATRQPSLSTANQPISPARIHASLCGVVVSVHRASRPSRGRTGAAHRRSVVRGLSVLRCPAGR